MTTASILAAAFVAWVAFACWLGSRIGRAIAWAGDGSENSAVASGRTGAGAGEGAAAALPAPKPDQAPEGN